MTRKEYRLIAYHLRERYPVPGPLPEVDAGSDWYAGRQRMWSECVHAVAQAFASDNPRFDYHRFYMAAGYDRRPDGAMYVVSLAGL
jgi:hypothetical protein